MSTPLGPDATHSIVTGQRMTLEEQAAAAPGTEELLDRLLNEDEDDDADLNTNESSELTPLNLPDVAASTKNILFANEEKAKGQKRRQKKKKHGASALQLVQEQQRKRQELREKMRVELNRKINQEKLQEKKALDAARRQKSPEAFKELERKLQQKTRQRLIDLEEGKFDPSDAKLDEELKKLEELEHAFGLNTTSVNPSNRNGAARRRRKAARAKAAASAESAEKAVVIPDTASVTAATVDDEMPADMQEQFQKLMSFGSQLLGKVPKGKRQQIAPMLESFLGKQPSKVSKVTEGAPSAGASGAKESKEPVAPGRHSALSKEALLPQNLTSTSGAKEAKGDEPSTESKEDATAAAAAAAKLAQQEKKRLKRLRQRAKARGQNTIPTNSTTQTTSE